MTKKHQYIEDAVIALFTSSHCSVIFESVADIQGFDQNGAKIIGEFKSEAEHRNNYSWWAYWKDILTPYYSSKLLAIKPENKRWIATVDGQLREYCNLERVDIGYLIVENYGPINQDIINALNFLKSEKRIRKYSGPIGNSEKLSYYTISYCRAEHSNKH